MSAIAGFFGGFDPELSGHAQLASMLAPLRHRGPDAEGYYLGREVGLAHARLGVIDDDSAAQPFADPHGELHLVCDGRIFNRAELQARLRGRGYRMPTGSDGEIIVHLYREYGLDFVSHLNGQFALALWDARRRRLVLARDRVGIAPLFYHRRDGRLWFASEIKGLLPTLPAAPRPNIQALDQIFTFWTTLAPYTLFEDIWELAPGTLLISERDGVRQHRYWDWAFPAAGDWHRAGEAELAETLRETLVDAIRLRRPAGTPVAAYLSGGLDSAALTALAEPPLASFGLAFDDPDYDERGHQATIASSLGVCHTTVEANAETLRSRLATVVRRAETVLPRAAGAPLLDLSRSARAEGFNVVLTGEGADEVLGGYELFREAKIRRWWAKAPDSERRPRLLGRLYPYLELHDPRQRAYATRFFAVGLERPDDPFFSHLPRWANAARSKLFLSAALRESLSEPATTTLARQLPAAWPHWHPLCRAQYLEVQTLLRGYLLATQGDRMLMANSVEGRFPYLDHRLIEFAARLPPRLKIKVLNEKYLLKRALRERLPAGVLRRSKQPYRAPDAALFAGQWPEAWEAVLSPAALRAAGLFDTSRVELLIRKARRVPRLGVGDTMALVGILSAQLWHHIFIERFAKP